MSRKLIIEKSDGRIYAYFESGRHFRDMQQQRVEELMELPPRLLCEQCDLDAYADGTFFCIDVKECIDG